MKKKTVRIILGIIVILLIGAAIFVYKLYQTISGSENLTGTKSSIPGVVKEMPPIDKGVADWPNWRGPDFNGKSNINGIKKDWTGGLEKLWAVDYLCQGQATASWAAPVIQGNRLIVPGRDEKNDLVFCINSNTGELIWKGSYEAASGTSHGPGARATPVIDNNKVYTFGRAGDLACWQLLDGKLLWKKNVKEIGGEEPDWGLSSTPIIYENKVIVQGGGKALVVAYDKENGDVIWKSMEGPSGYSASLIAHIDSTTLLMVYHGKALSCLNPENGKEIWRVPWETEYGVNASTPVIENNILFHTSGYGKGAEALKISKDGYTVLWTRSDFAAQHSDPFIIDGFIYGYSGESSNIKGEYKCIELSTGKEMWTSKEIGQGTGIYVDSCMISFDIKGNLYLSKPNTKGLNLIGSLKSAMPEVTNPSWTTPVIANGKLYLRYMQKLICYNLMP